MAQFDFTENGAIVIPATIKGTTVPMALDTGAPLSAIDPESADKLRLVQRDIPRDTLWDIAGETFMHTALIPDLGLGGQHASDVRVLVWPATMAKNGEFSGTIAADLLRHYDVDIDFGVHKLGLFSQDHCPGQVVYWTSGAVAVIPVHVTDIAEIALPVKLDGQLFNAVLDTGSGVSTMSALEASDKFDLSPNSPGMVSASDDDGPGGIPVYIYTFKTLDLGGLSIGNPLIDILQYSAKSPHLGQHLGDAARGAEPADMILGLRELHHLHLYIAYREQKLYISPASEPLVAVSTNGTAAASAAPPAASATPTAAH